MSDGGEDFHPNDSRFYVPRSGYKWLADVSGRSLAACEWFNVRIRQLMGMGWSLRGVLDKEIPNEPWR